MSHNDNDNENDEGDARSDESCGGGPNEGCVRLWQAG